MLRLLLLGLVVRLSSGLNNGLARTPPMGWLSWERFRCQTDCVSFPDVCISEKLYMTMADKIIDLGFKDLGYEYVNIDDCWLAEERDPVTGKLVPDPDRFPSGISGLADYMHARGLKLGIYEDFGSKTCAGYPGSEYNLELDASTFAEWGVDMVKFDGCNSDVNDMPIGFPTMEFFMNKTGHPMLFSCEWANHEDANGLQAYLPAIRDSCNTWRAYKDVQDSWDSVTDIIQFYGNNTANFSAFTGPGSFADPDMLLVGDFGLSYYQQRAQFGMWAMFAAPLIMSVDLRTISQEAIGILQNRNVIAINQDPLGIQATKQKISNMISVWRKPLVDGSTAIAFLNIDNHGRPMPVQTTLSDLGLMNANGYNVTEVFDDKPMGVFKSSSPFNVLVDPTSILLLRAAPL